MKIFIVHGYAAAPTDHWFPWLAGKLTAQGHDVVVVALPDSVNPVRTAWESTLDTEIGRTGGVGDDTVIVAHSLGSITAIRWLLAQPAGWRLRGLVTVAGFDGALSALVDLDAYLAQTLSDVDLATLRTSIGTRVAVYSDDDPFVPLAQARALSGALDVVEHEVSGAGHFLGADGHLELPVVWDAVEKICAP